VFKLNRIIGFLILAALIYSVLQAYGLLPDGARYRTVLSSRDGKGTLALYSPFA
jgi:hypothetical protein